MSLSPQAVSDAGAAGNEARVTPKTCSSVVRWFCCRGCLNTLNSPVMPNRRQDVQKREAECPGQTAKEENLHQGEVFPQLLQVKHLASICSPGGCLVDTQRTAGLLRQTLAVGGVAHAAPVGRLSEQDTGPVS